MLSHNSQKLDALEKIVFYSVLVIKYNISCSVNGMLFLH